MNGTDFLIDTNIVIYLTQGKLKTSDFASKGSNLIRKSKKIKLPDAILAATAIVYDLTLVTCNSDDFKNIPELKILTPLP